MGLITNEMRYEKTLVISMDAYDKSCIDRTCAVCDSALDAIKDKCKVVCDECWSSSGAEKIKII
jgi:hypothetical protein